MNHGQCIHFTGLMDERCSAGICYEDAFGKEAGIAHRLPCIQFMEVPKSRRSNRVRPGEETVRHEVPRYGQQMVPCELFQAPTDEQVKQYREESERSLRDTMLALQVASRWAETPKPKRDRHEVVECPSCKGKLHLMQSALNGHVHGRCETPNCLHWLT